MVGDDGVVEIVFRQVVPFKLRHILLLHECGAGVAEGRHGRLQGAVGVCGADAEALGERRLNVGAVAVAAQCRFQRPDTQKQRINLFALRLTEAHGDEIPVLVDFLVKRVLDLLHGHFAVDGAQLVDRRILRRHALPEVERVADALLLHIAGRVVRHFAGGRGMHRHCRTGLHQQCDAGQYRKQLSFFHK